MSEVGVRELRQNLSKYLRRVAEGEELVVTERNRPVARLAPLVDVSHIRNPRLRQLALEGKATPPSASMETLPPPVEIEGASLSEALEWTRGER